MTIFVIGINHKTASIELRERFYFAPHKLSFYLQDIQSQELAKETVLLSTCNRTELYFEADHAEALFHWLATYVNLSLDEMQQITYSYKDQEAVAHIMRVASGLDSMILGEPQILGQMKEAFTESCAVGMVGSIFHRVFQHVFSVAKDIRGTTAIGACPVSVASASIRFIKEKLANFSDAKVLVLGAGETSALLIRYLQACLSTPIMIANRNLEKAEELAKTCKGVAHSLNDIPLALLSADLVMTATGSVTPLITKTMMQELMPLRAKSAIMMMDIAMPRDIAADVNEVDGVTLFCIDDLKVMIDHNKQGREHAATKANEMIVARAYTLIKQLRNESHLADAIRTYRGQVEEICQAELLKAKLKLQQGVDPQIVLDNFARAFTNKMLHTPSTQMRQAAAEGRFELLAFAKQLFAI